MDALIWLLIPLAAAISAGIWSVWATRQRADGSFGDVAGVAGYAAFRSAMEAPRTPSAGGRIATDGPSRAAD